MKGYREQLNCGFPQVEDVFDDCMAEALSILSNEGVDRLSGGRRLSMQDGARRRAGADVPRGMASTAKRWANPRCRVVMEFIHKMHKSPNGKAIIPFLQTLAPVARAPAFPGADAGLPGSGTGFHGSHHRIDSWHPHHLSQPRPARFLRPDALPAQPDFPARA